MTIFGSQDVRKTVWAAGDCGSVHQRVGIMRRHLELFCREAGEQIAVREMKKHVGWYARGFAGAADIRRACQQGRVLR